MKSLNLSRRELGDGSVTEDDGNIEEEVISFYKRVYTKEENTTWLERPFQDDEMMKAIWDCCQD